MKPRITIPSELRNRLRVLVGDVLSTLPTIPDGSVNCCVTSPPYFGLRDYGHEGQIGLEPTPAEYVAKMVAVFREVRRVLRDDGTLWLNLGDSYANDGKWGGSSGGKHASALHGNTSIGRTKVKTGLKPKDLIGIPWRVAFALQADGWYLRQDIIWHKPNPMPESVRDRCTKAHEYLFLFSKNAKYYFDSAAVQEPARNWGTRDRSDMRGGTTDPLLKHYGLAGKPDEDNPRRNKRSVWTVATSPYNCAHFATFPPKLIEPCILAGCPPGGVVLDPFGGSGTTAGVAMKHGRCAVLCELNPEYAALVPARVESIRSKGAA